MVAEEGFEPPTSRIWAVRSDQLSYSANNYHNIIIFFKNLYCIASYNIFCQNFSQNIVKKYMKKKSKPINLAISFIYY